jgi:hypothetical protein
MTTIKHHCSFCGRPLDEPADPLSVVHDGNCLACIADAAHPDAQATSRLVAAKAVADRGETSDVIGWTQEQFLERFFH